MLSSCTHSGQWECSHKGFACKSVCALCAESHIPFPMHLEEYQLHERPSLWPRSCFRFSLLMYSADSQPSPLNPRIPFCVDLVENYPDLERQTLRLRASQLKSWIALVEQQQQQRRCNNSVRIFWAVCHMGIFRTLILPS